MKAQARLQQTLASRNSPVPPTVLRFNPPLLIRELGDQLREYEISSLPLFFENKQYEFEFIFDENRYDSGSPVIKHRLQAVEDAFHYSARSHSLRGSINFGNDIGWFKLKLAHTHNNKLIEQTLSFEVLPLKMDMHTDLDQIQQEIDKKYPLWRFALSNKTEQELERSRKPHERFPLLWLTQFNSLREELQRGIREILNSPHSRLLPYHSKLRAERIKGKLRQRLEERVAVGLAQHEMSKRYDVQQRRLSSDTPENRFIKYVLQCCVRELGQFIKRAEQHDAQPENSRLSATFYAELRQWQQPLNKQLNQPFFRDISAFAGLNNESLVLQQKAGYARVYRVWQQLKMYLDVLGDHAAVSVKSIAELYEVWCFLKVRYLLEELGFTEKSSLKVTLNKSGLERKLKDGRQAAFVLVRNGTVVRLSHEPLFHRIKSNLKQGIYSWTTVQKPDILMEVTLPEGQSIFWIFDAKYRLRAGNGQDTDLPPDDAINQMHRYRDALIHADSADEQRHIKTRPVYGAFVLYPGWFDENKQQNPAQAAIDEVGIGSFPLLPGQPCLWLKHFLEQQLGAAVTEETAATSTKSYSTDQVFDSHYVREAGRISYSGTQSVRYQNLTFVTALGARRSEKYKEGFRSGKARWYHTKVKTSERKLKRMAQHVMREVRYCAFAVHEEKGIYQRAIRYVYPVLNVRRVRRDEINAEQSGTKNVRNPEEEYWLFELGKAMQQTIDIRVNAVRDRHFRFLLTGLNDLATAESWDDLPDRYAFLKDT